MNGSPARPGLIWQSLSTRVPLIVAAALLFAIIVLAIFAGAELKAERRSVTADQQIATIRLVAGEVNEHLRERLAALSLAAPTLLPLMVDARQLQKNLETRPVLASFFNQGVAVTDVNGVVIASVPASLGRVGLDWMGREEVASALTQGKSHIASSVVEPACYALVVTDYNMPGMSGLEVVRAVRRIRADLPVAIASGFVDEALRSLAAEVGVRELIFKASGVEKFCQAIEGLTALKD